jgi:hypothetical protein
MKLPDIKSLVREQAVFSHFEDGKLWYDILFLTDDQGLDDDGSKYYIPANFQFPVPVEDTAGARFFNVDKGLFFMRWIRKHLEFLRQAQDDSAAG